MRSALCVFCLALAGPASAVTITLGGTLTTSSGVMSSRAADIIATFDSTDGACLSGPVVNGVLRPLASGPQSGEIMVDDADIAGRRLRPGTDSGNRGCYLSVSTGLPVNESWGPAGLLSIIVDDDLLFSYFGFYWGSIDSWNQIAFYDAAVGGSPISLGIHGDELSGDDLLRPGVALSDSVYVNLDFAAGEVVRRVELLSLQPAIEVDNLAFILRTPKVVVTVPQPASLGLFGLGVLGLLLLRRHPSAARAASQLRPS